jgi:peptide/nickel transport system substrate-binding protein
MSITRRELVAAAAGLVSCAAPRKPDNSTVTILYPESQTDSVMGPRDDMCAKFLVFAPLAAWNKRGELEPRLAESWQYSSDFSNCTIRLREGVRWHDGAPVTVHDVKFTLDLLQHPDVLETTPGSYTVDVLDHRTFRIACRRQEVSADGIIDDWFVPWPKHLCEKLDPKAIYTWDFWQKPVGCGPYRHARTMPETLMDLEANPDYFRGRPSIPRVTLKFGNGSAVVELLSCNADAVAYSRTTDALKLRGDHRFRVYHQPITTGPALWWNHRHPLFQDAAVRFALTSAINRRELSQFLDVPDDVRLMGYMVTQRQLRRKDYPEPVPYRPELARELLERSGWIKRPGRRLRERDGRPFRFKTMVLSSQADNVNTAVYVQDQLKRFGVQMDIVSVGDPPLVKGRIQRGEFEAGMMMLGTSLMGSFLREATGYNNDSYFALLDRVQNTFDPEERDRLYNAATGLFQQDMPATLLYPNVWTTLANSRIRGLDDHPYRGDLTQCMDDLWLEEVA